MRRHFLQARAKRSRRPTRALVRKQDLEVETLSFVPDRRIATTRLTVEQEADADRAWVASRGGGFLRAELSGPAQAGFEAKGGGQVDRGKTVGKPPFAAL